LEYQLVLEWTGERFLPWIKDSTIAYEHLHRYAFAATLVKDKRVLDLACGEGYGARILAAAAASVVGVDIDADVVRHASAKYGTANLEFVAGSITAVPIPDDQSFDVIVCFEAIEHIEHQEALLAEIKRLLKPDGVFVVSTPNKAIYHDKARDENPFHLKELYFEEFQALLARNFRNTQFLGQRIHPSSSIWPIGAAAVNGFHEFVMERGGSEFEFIGADKRVPLYFIAIASDTAVALPRSGSVLLDHSDSLIEEKDQETRWRTQQVAERDETIRSLEEAVKWREGQIEKLTEGLEWTRNRAGELEETIASQEEALTWRAQQVNELETAKGYWERESASLTARLQNTQRELVVAANTLAGIYASRGWKFIKKLRSIRDALKGLFRG
jgi:2-polyprenyl-3-methyl-5-hydroxy-6-metoxy-1,4-benzoquinol methylase